MATQKPVGDLTYEQARDELVAIVAKLEAGAATLDESLALWERGEALAAQCQVLLQGAREKITQVRDAADAGVVAIAVADEEDDA